MFYRQSSSLQPKALIHIHQQSTAIFNQVWNRQCPGVPWQWHSHSMSPNSRTVNWLHHYRFSVLCVAIVLIFCYLCKAVVTQDWCWLAEQSVIWGGKSTQILLQLLFIQVKVEKYKHFVNPCRAGRRMSTLEACFGECLFNW